MKNLFLFILFAFVISSCKKEKLNTHSITGTLTEIGTGLPIVGANVKFQTRVPGFFGYDHHVLATTISNASGKFFFEYTPNNNDEDFFFLVNSKKHFEFWSIEYSFTKNENYINFELIPTAFISLHLKNVNPVNENDFIYARAGYKFGTTHYEANYNLSREETTGMNVDKRTNLTVSGNHIVYMSWEVTKNNVKKYFIDSIFTKSHETVNFEINY